MLRIDFLLLRFIVSSTVATVSEFHLNAGGLRPEPKLISASVREAERSGRFRLDCPLKSVCANPLLRFVFIGIITRSANQALRKLSADQTTYV